MKDVHETDIFQILDAKNNIRKKVESNIKNSMVDLKPYLTEQLRRVRNIWNDNLTNKTLAAIESGNIIVYYTPGADRLPIFYPFIKFKVAGVPKIAVDISNFNNGITKNAATDELNVKIDDKKLYTLITSAYLYLAAYPTKDSTLPPYLATMLSDLWAKLFCNVLVAKAGLGTNKDRYEAFMYFAQKYFLLNILEVPPQTADDIAAMQFKGKTLNPTTKQIAEACASRGLEMYTNLPTFCNVLFNADITGLRALKVSNNNNEVMNFEAFLRNYITTYYAASGLSLAALPYFMWMTLSANMNSGTFKDNLIIKFCGNDYPKIMSEINRMI